MTEIYLLSPPRFEPDLGERLKSVLDAVAIPCFQLRLKDAGDDEWKRAIDALMPICVKRNAAFIVNDRVDLAKQFNCDGVHVGATDAPYEDARRILGGQKIIGVSAYASRDAAMDYAAAGADYVAFGSVFPSGTKQEAPPVELSVFEDWITFTTTPCVAIGGITAENCAPLVQAGVDFLAVIGAVWNHAPGAAAGAKLLQNAIKAAKSDI